MDSIEWHPVSDNGLQAVGRHRRRARYEPFGLSVLEAAQAGCALVLGDIPSLRENWDGAALFAAPDDDDALRDALRRLIEDDALRARFGARARRRAMFMTAARMADEYLGVCEEPLVSRGAAAHLGACA